jgi:hypothetical protein
MSKAKKRAPSKGEQKKKDLQKSRQTGIIVLVIAIVAIVAVSAVIFLHGSSHSTITTTTGSTPVVNSTKEPVILYVNQGNALVDRSNFSALLSFAKSNGFNTIFFQIYRSGQLLFDSSDLSYFVETAHLDGLSLYYSLYFTASSQIIPTSIFNLGENGINLDMSTLPVSAQSSLLATLKLDFTSGTTAVTSTNLTTTLKPDLLVLETYSFQQDESAIHPGIVAAVEPLSLSSQQEYQQEVKYALSNSSGVMVFDYYGLLKTGY